nr:hypothetical protein [Tanacetum cinerariifolium]
IPSPSLPVSPPLPVSSSQLPASPTYPLGYRVAMIRPRAKTPSTSHPPPPIVLLHTKASLAMLRAAGPSTYILASRSETPQSRTPPLLPIPLPTSSPPLILPSTSHRVDVLEVTLPPRKRLCIALGLRFEVGESSSAPTARPTGGFREDYGFVATLDDEIRRDPERDVGYGITDTWDEILDTDEIYERLDDAQDDRLLMSGPLNMLRRDRRAHARTARLMKSEATLSRKAWVQSMDASDTARAEMAALQRRQGPARGPTHPKAPEEAGVADALATRDAERSQNGEDNHDSETGVRRQAPPAHLKKKMTGKYFPRGEIKKLEELALMCTRMFPEESDKIEMYIGGLPDMIHGSVIASKPKTMQDEFADELALITFPPRHDDLLFDIESDPKEIEYLLNNDPINDMDSILEDSVDEDNLADLNDNLVDTMPEMFTDEH